MRPSRRVEWLVLGGILALAAGLRLTRLDLIEFKYDEATTMLSALRIVREGQLPAVGMVSSRGPHNPALMSYVLAPAVAISGDPRVAAGWLALLGVAAVGVTYWLGNSYFGWPVGALAATLFASSPWAVFLSRKTWAQNLPLLTLAFVAAMLALVARRRPWALAGALAAAAGLVSLHLGGLAFFLVAAVVLALFPRRVRPLPLLAGLVLATAILSPYLIHDARQGWQNVRAFGQVTAGQRTVDLQALRTAVGITGGLRFESLTGKRFEDFLAHGLSLGWLDAIEAVLALIGLAWSLGYVLWERVRRKELRAGARARVVLLCWFGVAVLLLTPRTTPVQPHDLALLLPSQHLAVSLLLVDVLGAVRRWGDVRWARVGATMVAVLVAVVVGWQTYLQQALLDFVDTNDTPGGHGAPAKYAIEAARRTQSLRRGGDGPVVALLPGGDARFDGQAAVFSALLPPASRLVDGRAALLVPASPAIFLVAPGADRAADLLAGVATELQPPLPTRAGSGDVYRFFRWTPGQHPLAPGADVHVTDARWESGVTLLGYGWEGLARAGASIQWRLVFRVTSTPSLTVDQPPAGAALQPARADLQPARADLHWFNHLVDRQGRRWGQADGVGFPSYKWITGDTATVWFDIAVDPDASAPPYTVRTGMYAYPEVRNISLVDPAGNPSGEWVDLGPVASSVAQ